MPPATDDPFPSFDDSAGVVNPALEAAREMPGLEAVVEKTLAIKLTFDEVDPAKLPKVAILLYHHVIAITFILYNKIVIANAPYSGSGQGQGQRSLKDLLVIANNLAMDLASVQGQVRTFVNNLKKATMITARITKTQAKGQMKAACDNISAFHNRINPGITLAEDFQSAYAAELKRTQRMPFPQPTVDGVDTMPDNLASDPTDPRLIMPQSSIVYKDHLNSSPSSLRMPQPGIGPAFHDQHHHYDGTPEHNERPGSGIHTTSIPPSSPVQSHSTSTYDAPSTADYDSEEEERLRRARLKKKKEKAAKDARRRREEKANASRHSSPDDDSEREYYNDYSSHGHRPRRPKESSPIPDFRNAGNINFSGARIQGAFNDFSVYRA